MAIAKKQDFSKPKLDWDEIRIEIKTKISTSYCNIREKKLFDYY